MSDTPRAIATSRTIDLDAIERDLRNVESALSRLADGTYWTDEITGEPIPEHVLVGDPTRRLTASARPTQFHGWAVLL